jgi:hypothetical protein
MGKSGDWPKGSKVDAEALYFRRSFCSSQAILATILIISFVLRVVLAAQGGQYFFGDEVRYDRGVQLYLAILNGHATIIGNILGKPEHALFVWLGAAMTAGQHLLAQLTPYGDWSKPENTGFTIWLGACLLAQFSTLNIYLVYHIARTAGATAAESIGSALLMAVSNTNFYYARHLLPYDAALSAALGAMACGFSRRTSRSAFVSGVLTGIAYGLYNGYWFFVPSLWVIYLTIQWRWPERWRLVGWWTTGLGGALAAPAFMGTMAGGTKYWITMVAFSRTVTQGLFSEGWSLPWEFLWHSEGLMGLLVIGSIAFAVLVARYRRKPVEARVWILLLTLGGTYALLVLASCGLDLFVVYARTVKPFVPLFCLLGGWAWSRILGARPLGFVDVGLVVVGIAFVHFRPHFGRMFPREVEIAVLRHFGNPKHTLSVSGSLYIPLAQPVTRPDLALVNGQLLYPVHGYLGFPEGRVLLRIPNPISYLPFQYESHTPGERTFLRSHNLSICLIQLANPASLPDELAPAFRYHSNDRPTGH